MKESIRKIFEDKDLLVIQKPPNVLSVPDRYNNSLFNIYQYFLQMYSDIKIVHRLDFETSGIMILAKNLGSHKGLNLQFQNRTVVKKYIALIHGVPIQQQGIINAPIRFSTQGKSYIEAGGKSSKTYYELMEDYKSYALIRVIPETGRTHQIRVHLQHMGHPIVGDKKYGGQPFYLSSIKRNYRQSGTEKPLISRTALHAYSIKFVHPTTHEEYSLESPYPKDLKATLNQLGKLRKS